MTLRVFFPSTDTTRVLVDTDAYYGTGATLTFAAGRFAGTTYCNVTPNGSNTYSSGQVYGFLRPYTHGGALRVAFDFLCPAGTATSAAPLSILTGATAAGTAASAANSLLGLTFSSTTNRLMTLAGSSREVPFQLQPGEWYHVEVELVPHDTTGSLKVWINNSLKLDVSGADTLGAAVPTTVWLCIGTRVACPVMWDDTGTDLTGYIGDFTPVALAPSADTAQADSTVTGAATRAAALADTSTASFVTLAANGDYDLYEFGDTAVTGTVKAVIVMADGYMLGNGESYMKAVVKSATVEADSAVSSELLTTGSTARNVLTAAFPTDPNTSAAWTIAGVNAAQFGLKAVIP